MSSVEKAFRLLEFLASRQRPASLQEVTRAVRLSKPTACRLLHQLEALGYVARAPEGRDYRTGPRAEALSNHDPYSELKAAARPLLRELHGALNETVNLGVLSGTQVLYLDYIETTQPLRYILTPGENDPYHLTALGRAIAAQQEPPALEALISTTHFSGRGQVCSESALREVLAKTARDGVAEEAGEAAEGVACLAVSLAPLGYPQAAISVAVPLQRYTPALRSAIMTALRALFP